VGFPFVSFILVAALSGCGFFSGIIPGQAHSGVVPPITHSPLFH